MQALQGEGLEIAHIAICFKILRQTKCNLVVQNKAMNWLGITLNTQGTPHEDLVEHVAAKCPGDEVFLIIVTTASHFRLLLEKRFERPTGLELKWTRNLGQLFKWDTV